LKIKYLFLEVITTDSLPPPPVTDAPTILPKGIFLKRYLRKCATREKGLYLMIFCLLSLSRYWFYFVLFLGFCLLKENRGLIFVPHPRDCKQYVVCGEAVPRVEICPGNLLWDSSTNVCNEPFFVSCFTGKQNCKFFMLYSCSSISY